MKFILQLFSGMAGFCLFSVSLWAFGVAIGVNNTLELIFFSYFSGIVLVYATIRIFVLSGTQYRFVFTPSSPLMTVNLFLASIIFCTIMGSAMLLSGKAIYSEGLDTYITYLFLPPMYMCFLPTLLMRWKAADGEKMTKEIAMIAKPFGFELAQRLKPPASHCKD